MGRAVSHPPIRGPQRLAASVTEATRIGTRQSFSRRSIETMGANSLPKYSGSVTNVRDSVFPSLQRGVAAPSRRSPRSEKARTGWSLRDYIAECVLKHRCKLTHLQDLVGMGLKIPRKVLIRDMSMYGTIKARLLRTLFASLTVPVTAAMAQELT